MLRLLLLLIFAAFSLCLYADDSGFPSTTPNSMPPPTNPYNSTATGSQNQTPGSSGSDTFGSMVQQQTSAGLQTFQNVNYQKLSGSEGQDAFMSDDSDSNPPDPTHLFNLFSGS